MSIIAAVALASSSLTLPNCSWDHPGRNPFMGDVSAAVDRYKDIPASVRQVLKARMAKHEYDDMVDIRRDAIVGKGSYLPGIRDMHYGQGAVCANVSRKKWSERMVERGLVYCEGAYCILVPTVCRNVSRIQKAPARAAAPAETENVASSVIEDDSPLMFEAPGAGGGGLPSPAFAQGVAPGVPTPGPSITPGIPPTTFGPPGTIIPVPTPTPVPDVPEPATYAMMLLGLAGVLALRWRKQA
ncbi:MHFG family PEP-CTERM protein [Roseateles sp. BYS180W]|uniref:MHFG family PEP-CTERM protein n=1 Tax=Roseateles rivi TaxID=3299028 RepID=A0ABW7FSZ2_9BURK